MAVRSKAKAVKRSLKSARKESSPSAASIIARGQAVLSPVLGKYFPGFVISRAKGMWLTDLAGKKYLDFTAGIGVTNVGHSHPKVVAAIQKQAAKLIHISFGVAMYESYITLAEKIDGYTPKSINHYFFNQSGAEAVEGAIKLARYVTKRPGIIAFRGGFHGRTYGAISLTTSKEKYQHGYAPLLPEIYYTPYPYSYRCDVGPQPAHPSEAAHFCLDALKELINSRGLSPTHFAAMIVEPVQGEGGYIPPAPMFLRELQAICNTHGILLILDEVQTGFGRTGKFFASEHSGIQPDVLCMAKGIAAGMPLGAIGIRKSLSEQWPPAAHGTTYGGNPVSCAAAMASIDVIEKENLVENARQQGDYLMEQLKKIQRSDAGIGDVRGLGLMIGIEFIKPGTAKPEKAPETNPDRVKKIREYCHEKGLVLLSCGREEQAIRFIPPLIINRKEADLALSIFEDAVRVTR